jgi:hypothetical protein
LIKADKVLTLWATPPVTVRMRYPRPDTWFRRDRIDPVNQRMQRGRDNGIGRSDCPDLMLFCSRRILEAILNAARN